MNLTRIGIELELNVEDYRDYFLRIKTGFMSQYTFELGRTSRGNPEINGFVKLKNKLLVQLTDEYYSSQCEWKLFPAPLSELSKIQTTLKSIVEQGGKIYHDSIPAFVGTHIHLFFKENKKDLQSFVRGKTILSAFLMEYFYYFFKEKTLPRKVLLKELERLCFNHNILQKLDYKLLGKGLRKNLNEKGFDYYYTNMPKDKYQPVHWSNPNNGKPLTLELRYIPNSFFMYSLTEDIKSFLLTVEDKVGYINSLSPEDFKKEHERNKEQCIYWHKKLLELYLEHATETQHLPRTSNSNTTLLQTFNFDNPLYSFEQEYIRLYRRGYISGYKKLYRIALQNVRNNIKKFLENNNSIIESEEQLYKILSHSYFKNYQELFQRYSLKIKKELLVFDIKSIKDIVVKKPGLYNFLPATIDNEGDEIILINVEQNNRPLYTFNNNNFPTWSQSQLQSIELSSNDMETIGLGETVNS